MIFRGSDGDVEFLWAAVKFGVGVGTHTFGDRLALALPTPPESIVPEAAPAGSALFALPSSWLLLLVESISHTIKFNNVTIR
jgi:hypothetical protein